MPRRHQGATTDRRRRLSCFGGGEQSSPPPTGASGTRSASACTQHVARASTSTPPQHSHYQRQHQQQHPTPTTAPTDQTWDTKRQRQQHPDGSNKTAKRGRSGGTSMERWLQTATRKGAKRMKRRPKRMATTTADVKGSTPNRRCAKHGTGHALGNAEQRKGAEKEAAVTGGIDLTVTRWGRATNALLARRRRTKATLETAVRRRCSVSTWA
jgi:hypothetical protein